MLWQPVATMAPFTFMTYAHSSWCSHWCPERLPPVALAFNSPRLDVSYLRHMLTGSSAVGSPLETLLAASHGSVHTHQLRMKAREWFHASRCPRMEQHFCPLLMTPSSRYGLLSMQAPSKDGLVITCKIQRFTKALKLPCSKEVEDRFSRGGLLLPHPCFDLRLWMRSPFLMLCEWSHS